MSRPSERSIGSAALLIVLGAGLTAVFGYAGRQPNLETRVPEFIGLMFFAGVLYLAGVYVVWNSRAGGASLFVILGVAVLIRLAALPARPSLTEDVSRYQWEGRIERAGINPYTVSPALPRLARFQDPRHPIETGKFTPTLYPPLSEWAFAWVKTIRGYKLLFLAFDLATLAALLLLLGAIKQPLARALAYAWNPAVVVSFSLSGHHDSLAIFSLVLGMYFTIRERRAISMVFLALSFLSKLFSGLLLPVFFKRMRWAYAGIFLGVVSLAYLPFASAGRGLVRGLSDYGRGWEGNDSLFRLIRWAGNSKTQAELIAVVLVLGLVIYALRRRMEPFAASLFILSGLLFLSPNAFPWYFTWIVPFLCFIPNPPLLLMTVTCVLGYSPVITYAAGISFHNQPLVLALEYAPVFAWLAWLELRETQKPKEEAPAATVSATDS